MEASNQSSGAVSTPTQDNLLSPPQSPSNRSSNEVSRPSENPLLNPLIVDLIVKQMDPDFEQMKTLRLVSKVWTQATQHRWRNYCAVLTIVPDPPNFSRSIYETGVSFSTFLNEFHNPESLFQLSQKPFLKYKLKDFTLDLEWCGGGNGGLDSPAYKFWNLIGPLMESLHFYKCFFTRPEDDSNSTAICPRVQFLVGLLPNLKHLALTDMTTPEAVVYWDYMVPGFDIIPDDDDEIADALVFEKGLSQLNLRTLTIYGDLKMDTRLGQLLMLAPGLKGIKGEQQCRRALLKQIHKVRYHSAAPVTKARPLSNLENVDLVGSMPLGSGHFPWDLFESPNPLEGVPVGSQVPLETLSLHLGAFGEDTDIVDTYLESLSSTLTTFTALRAPAGPPYSLFLVNASMTALTELNLMGTVAPNLKFLKSTPNLKKLRIDLGCFEKRDELKDLIRQHNEDHHENWRYEKYQDDMVMKVGGDLKEGVLCTELEHLEIDFEYPEESLRLLGKWMPNLKILKTILNVGTVPVVCEIWNELKELVCMHGSKIENYCFIPTDENEDFPGNPSERKICHLKDLERFRLDAYCDDCNLTDDVVYKGFLKMSGLKCVEICVNSQMSTEAEEALRKGIQFCKVVRDDHDDCGGSALFGTSSFLCDRCTFRNEVIYGIGRNDEDSDDSDQYNEHEILFGVGSRLGPQLVDVDSDDDAFSASSDSSN